jgi:hypothetical protein
MNLVMLFVLSDIESLLKANRDDIDWSLINEYFDLFEMKELFYELKGKYEKGQQI